MPYLETWSEFLEQAQQLFVASPGRTRLVTKFRAEQALAHHPGMGMGVGHDASGSGSGAGAGAGAGAGGSGSGGGGKKGGRKGRHHGDGGESHGSLVVKVTDDVKCLKYRTNKREDVKNLEKLSAWVINLTTSKVSHSGVVDGGASEASTRHGNKRHRTQSGGRDTKRKSGAQRRRAKKARAK